MMKYKLTHILTIGVISTKRLYDDIQMYQYITLQYIIPVYRRHQNKAVLSVLMQVRDPSHSVFLKYRAPHIKPIRIIGTNRPCDPILSILMQVHQCIKHRSHQYCMNSVLSVLNDAGWTPKP